MADDYDKLLADVERSLGGGAPAPTPGRPSKRGGAHPAAVPAERGRLATNVQVAVVSGAVAAGLVFLLFFFVPFLGAVSGAAGAFLATTLAVLVTSYLRRS